MNPINRPWTFLLHFTKTNENSRAAFAFRFPGPVEVGGCKLGGGGDLALQLFATPTFQTFHRPCSPCVVDGFIDFVPQGRWKWSNKGCKWTLFKSGGGQIQPFYHCLLPNILDLPTALFPVRRRRRCHLSSTQLWLYIGLDKKLVSTAF